jgi:transposase InsO family protein
MTSNPTGYGPRLLFDGEESKYDLWEMKFLGHMRILKLDKVFKEDEPNPENNITAFAQMIQYLDDKSLSLIMNDAMDDGKKALGILRDHYRGKGKPRVIHLYSQLINLKMEESEEITDYLIKVEQVLNSLKSTGEDINDNLLVAIVMKGLTSKYSTFCAVMSQKTDDQTFAEFKVALKAFDENEKFRNLGEGKDNIMKTNWHEKKTEGRAKSSNSYGHSGQNFSDKQNIKCFKCEQFGHKSFECKNRSKKWCSVCRRNTHNTAECRKQRKDSAKTVSQKQNSGDHSDEDGGNVNEHSFVFNCKSVINDFDTENDFCKSILVDCGATTHIVTSKDKFISFCNADTDNHVIELADGSRSKNIVKAKGDACVTVNDKKGVEHKVLLKNALYIPSYKQDIFSVQAAVSNGANVNFSEGKSELTASNGTVFDIKKKGRLYYLNSVEAKVVSRSVEEWHEIMGHCNVKDVCKLEGVVNGMKISNKCKEFQCDVCTLGKMPQVRSHKPDQKAKSKFELVHCDLSGPIAPVAREGFRYCLMFVDDYTGVNMIYFLKSKCDTIEGTKKFLSDIAPYGKVKTLRSDNGTEFSGKAFESLMRDNQIKHEFSAPYSPHQNGTVERGWRTIFDMARCLLIQGNVPKYLWTYAVYT